MKARHLFLIGLSFVALICFISCKINHNDHSKVVVDSTKYESIVDILSKLDCAGSGYVYLYNSNAIVHEYKAHLALYKMLDSAYKSGSGDLRIYNMRYLIEDRIGVTKSYLDTFKIKLIAYPEDLGKTRNMIILTNSPGDRKTNESLLMTNQNVAPATASATKVAVKPPNPCPIGTSCVYTATSISYYTVNSKDSCNVYKNKSKITVDTTYYDSQTHIKTFYYKEPITGKKIEIHYSVTYPGDQDNVSENGLYIEVIE